MLHVNQQCGSAGQQSGRWAMLLKQLNYALEGFGLMIVKRSDGAELMHRG
jgi:hypothetical protein